MAFPVPALQQYPSDDERAGYYNTTYGSSRLRRAYKITRDSAALLTPEEQGRPGLVNLANDAVQQISPTTWTVRSQRDRDVFYTVRRQTRRRYTCTCPDPELECKHKKAVRFRGMRGLAAADPTQMTPLSPLERWQRRFGQRRYTHAFFPQGSSVRKTGAFAVTLLPPTGHTTISYDEENIADERIRLRSLVPCKNGRPVELTRAPDEDWFNNNC